MFGFLRLLAVATLAAIQATKLTQQLIPLCHAIPIEAVDVDFQWIDFDPHLAEAVDAGRDEMATLRCLVRVRTTGKTGVEMEAMTGTSVAALTVYDMVKSIDRRIVIGAIRLLEKSGGKSGEFRANSAP